MATTMTQSAVNRLEQWWDALPKKRPPVNVGERERWLSLMGGGLLTAFGLSRRSLGGLALAAVGGSLLYRGASGHCSLYAALDVDRAEHHPPHTVIPAGHGVKIDTGITILREPAELYSAWRNLENLPRLLRHLESVRSDGSSRSHWTARGPLGHRAEWDAEIFNEKENELIAWRSLPDAEVATAGSIHFTRAPGDRGTEMRVVLKYEPPGGKAGSILTWLFGEDPATQVREDLRRFKQHMEIGAAPTIQGQPRGTCGH